MGESGKNVHELFEILSTMCKKPVDYLSKTCKIQLVAGVRA